MESIDTRINRIQESLKSYSKIKWVNDIVAHTDTQFERKIAVFTKRDEFGNKVDNL